MYCDFAIDIFFNLLFNKNLKAFEGTVNKIIKNKDIWRVSFCRIVLKNNDEDIDSQLKSRVMSRRALFSTA